MAGFIFVKDTYADVFERLYIGAYREGEYYGDITINIPMSLDDDEVFLSNDCPNLIREMIANDYLEVVRSVAVNMGTYTAAKVTDKLKEVLVCG